MGASFQHRRGAGDTRLDRAEVPTCTLWYIRSQLGRSDYSDRRMVDYVAQLIDQRGFPKPYPCRRGRAIVDGPVFDSRWNRHAVDTWLHHFLPPDAAAALDAAEHEAAAAEMDQAAFGLRLVANRDQSGRDGIAA